MATSTWGQRGAFGAYGATQLSPNFTLEEFTRSSTASSRGLDNTPTSSARQALQKLAGKVLEPMRKKLGKSITISSGYRSPEVNAAVGGASSSQHMSGEAADIKVSGMTNRQLMDWMYEHRAEFPFDQVMMYWDTGHVHVSTKLVGTNRGQFLYKPPPGSAPAGRTTVDYRPGMTLPGPSVPGTTLAAAGAAGLGGGTLLVGAALLAALAYFSRR